MRTSARWIWRWRCLTAHLWTTSHPRHRTTRLLAFWLLCYRFLSLPLLSTLLRRIRDVYLAMVLIKSVSSQSSENHSKKSNNNIRDRGIPHQQASSDCEEEDTHYW